MTLPIAKPAAKPEQNCKEHTVAGVLEVIESPRVGQHELDDSIGQNQQDSGRTEFADVQRVMGVSTVFHFHEKRSGDGSQNPDSGQDQRQQDGRQSVEIVHVSGL